MSLKPIVAVQLEVLEPAALRMDYIREYSPDPDWRFMDNRRWRGLDGLVHETYVMSNADGGNAWRDTLCGYEIASRSVNRHTDIEETQAPVTCLGCLAEL